MSQKNARKIRQIVRRNYRFQYLEFLKLTEVLKFWERFSISYATLFKLGSREKRRRLKNIKKQQKEK